jgi:hypothetical protein
MRTWRRTCTSRCRKSISSTAASARTASAVAAQAGIPTSADARAAQAAFAREHARQAARIRPPRHQDYAEFSNPAPRPGGPVQFGDEPWNGSLPVYTR